MNMADLKKEDCRFYLGDSMDKNYDFCGKKSIEGKPYCEEHSKLAFRKAYEPHEKSSLQV